MSCRLEDLANVVDLGDGMLEILDRIQSCTAAADSAGLASMLDLSLNADEPCAFLLRKALD